MQKEISQTLNCMHDRQAGLCVPINSMIIGKGVKLTDRQTTGIGEDGEPAPTLQAGHHHAVAVSEYVIDKHLCKTKNCSPAIEREGAHNLNVIKCYEFNPTDTRVKETEISPTVLSRWGTGGNQIPLAASCGFARRLTTVECARLQGFPDHHTEIPWRGKPAEKCPRAPQYKAYGNSMCVNVIEWLGRGIAEELANPAPFEIHYPEQQTFNF